VFEEGIRVSSLFAVLIFPSANFAFSAVDFRSRGAGNVLEFIAWTQCVVPFFAQREHATRRHQSCSPRGVDSLTKLALEIGAIAGVGLLVELMIPKLRRGPRRRTDSRIGDRRC
jgi:hypothetical protein